MASPPNCAYCNTANVTITNQYFDAEVPGLSMVLLSCGHACIVQNGAWVRLGSVTGAKTATATDSANLETSGKTQLTTKAITSFKNLCRGLIK